MMKNRKIDNIDELIFLFFLSVVGTLALSLYFFTPVTPINWIISIKQALLMGFIFSYEFVMLSLGVHYIETKKDATLANLKKHSAGYAILAVIIGLIIYAAISYVINGNILQSLKDVVYLFIILLGGLAVQLIIASFRKNDKERISPTIKS